MAIPVHEPSYKNVIGITSLWLLYPLLTYAIKCIHKNVKYMTPDTSNAFAFLWVLLCCIISHTMWKDYDTTGFLYTLDICFARGTFVILLYLTCFVYPRCINTYAIIMLPLGVAGFYALTCKLYDYEYFELASWAHLMFRFIGFWWTYIAFNHTVTLNRFLVVSFVYWANIA